ncbi:glutaminyl-peptide cyclotransferase [Robertkochia sediminum]|uniref:glutaminyl-peptide cyclotransferase n=1 Tax=Robertkochia sediminum TaxID=2785326 RepID=UPI0019341D49|nr:glutaminyl-peptide cyclotransferase [Robertkochia sediminum]MBL7473600.1 glutaminyl-peptide cyclotransferase [Robertkochia sediminum]
MFTYKVIVFSLLSVFALSCGGEQQDVKKLFRLEVQAPDKKINHGERVKIALTNRKDITVDSVHYFLNDTRVFPENNEMLMAPKKLGEQVFKATIFTEGETMEITTNPVVLASKAPTIYTYEIINTFPHDMEAFTQGLEFHNNELFESTGRKGFSSLRKVDLETGEIKQIVPLNSAYFGEGITIMNNKVYQLTWKAGKGFTYDLETFELMGEFPYTASKEGWGLTNNGEVIYMSDGTDKIWILDPNTMKEKDHLQIVTNSSVFNKANELEYVDGKIYANVWLKDSAMIIDAETGAITGVIDFRGLKDQVKKHDQLDVLNGIAYHPERKTFFVTGKNWDTLFEVKIIEKS